jgi:hypothetical protein
MNKETAYVCAGLAIFWGLVLGWSTAALLH